MRISLSLIMLLMALFSVNANSYENTPKTIGGYKVLNCQYVDDNAEFDPSENYDFCSTTAINAYKKFSEKDINFNHDYVLIVINKFYYVALNPKTKEVYPVPFSIYYLNDKEYRKAKITFKKDNNYICSYEKNVGFNPLDAINASGGDPMPNTKYCIDFLSNGNGKSFSDIAQPYNFKTNQPISKL